MNLLLKIVVILFSFCGGLLTMAIYNAKDNYNNCRDDNIITVSYVMEQHKEWDIDCKARIEKIETNCGNRIKQHNCTLNCIRDTAYASDFDTAVDHCLRECGQKDE